jgi:hypothetical protein
MPRPVLSFLCKEYRALSALGQRPGDDADEIKIVWNYSSTPPMCECGEKDQVKLKFTL